MEGLSNEEYKKVIEHAKNHDCSCNTCLKASQIKGLGNTYSSEILKAIPFSNDEFYKIDSEKRSCPDGKHTFIDDGYKCGYCDYRVIFTYNENPNT